MIMKHKCFLRTSGNRSVLATFFAAILSSTSLIGSVSIGHALDQQYPTEFDERRNRSAQFFADIASSAVGAGRYDKAVDAYMLLRLKPGDERIYFNRGNAYRKEGAVREALKDLRDAIALDPSPHVALINRSAIYVGQGKFEALRDYTLAIAPKPKDAMLYVLRGTAYMRRNQVVVAVDDFSTALNLDPSCAPALSERGYAYLRLGDADQARADFQRAVQIGPHSKRAMAGLAAFERAP
jgi:Flp pilus assembly protein TadD